MNSLLNLNKGERLDLLYLLDDLNRAGSCNERQELIESNKMLQAFGKRYDFPEGYLFDVFLNITKLRGRSIEKRVTDTILNI
ncbi:MAG: hypothetical protein OXN83_03710 [Oligoflexia bacterium]|nr:hypothetical protein [Oligoflexia bacterium]